MSKRGQGPASPVWLPHITPSNPLPIYGAPGYSVDVALQDQNSPIVNWILHNDLETLTLAANTIVDQNTITLQAGHSTVVGNIINLLGNNSFYQGTVTNVAGNTITLDIPVDHVFLTTDHITRGNGNANVDGSGTRVLFHGHPPPGQLWDITYFSIVMLDDAAMDDSKFGSLAALTNGLCLRKKNNVYDNIGVAKNNLDFKAQGCNVTYWEKSGGGEYSIQAVCRFAGQQNAGVTVRLDGDTDEEIEMIVQDDLRNLTQISSVVVGHVVVN